MRSTLAKLKSWKFLLFILFLQVIVNVTVSFDIQIFRQIIGFLYLTFIPGIIIIKLLKLDELNEFEKILFSVGFSIVFLMLMGLILNECYLLFGLFKPLSYWPMLVFVNGSILFGAVWVSLRSGRVEFWNVENFHWFSPVLLLLGLPVMSFVGALWVNAFENNIILLLLMITISFIFMVGIFSERLTPETFYPFAVAMIAVSLLFHVSLISNYLGVFGSDAPAEHFVFKTTLDSGRWISMNTYVGDTAYGRLNAMLSITILPTVYSSLLNIDSGWVFKLLYPLFFSLVPLGLYQIWQKYIGKKFAFIAAFLFMAQQTFYGEMLGLNRQMVAELFFVLLLLSILNNNIKKFSKMICFILFSFALITSHYGLAEIFLFFVSFAFIYLFIIKKTSRNISASMIVLFSVIMFMWYIYTSDSAVFDSFLEFGSYVYRQMGDFFNLASRGQTVLRGLGLEKAPTIWNAISRVFAYGTEFLILVGFLGLVTKRVKGYFDREWVTFSFIAMMFLIALVLVPGLANTMNMTRFYHILLFFLSPLCVIGAEFLVKLMGRRDEAFLTYILLIIVLVPYFLFQTSFVYEITGSESWSIPLSGYRMGPKIYTSFGFVTDQEANSALWLSQYKSPEDNIRIHVDIYSRTSLSIYGMIPYTSMSPLNNVTIVEVNDYVYLGKLNNIYGMVYGLDEWNTNSIKDSILSEISEVYSNGICNIYKTN